MGIVILLLALVLLAVLINYLVPGGVTGMPGLIIFVIIAVLLVAGGYYSGGMGIPKFNK
jgi:hypothetical protein